MADDPVTIAMRIRNRLSAEDWAYVQHHVERSISYAAARRALFMCASHCQGGHSYAGDAAAEVLGVPFPIQMPDLIAKAREEGINPAELWPWLKGHNYGAGLLITAEEWKRAADVL